MSTLSSGIFCLSLFLGLALFGSKTLAQDSYADSVLNLRLEKEVDLRKRKTSPLMKQDRKSFHGLEFYDVSTAWKKTTSIEWLDQSDTLDFATSSGRIKKFTRYAILHFEHDGQPFQLTAFKRVYPKDYVPNHAPYLFIPFTDINTGSETYGGGRYMDTEVPEEGSTSLILDFNGCYNPYCAYGSGFSCPIPPKENGLELKVDAGERGGTSH